MSLTPSLSTLSGSKRSESDSNASKNSENFTCSVIVELRLNLTAEQLRKLKVDSPVNMPTGWWEAELKQALQKLPVESLLHVIGSGLKSIEEVYLEAVTELEQELQKLPIKPRTGDEP